MVNGIYGGITLAICLTVEQISFQPLVQCLDVDNLIQLFTAVLLERRILLRSNKFVRPSFAFLRTEIIIIPVFFLFLAIPFCLCM